MANKASKLETLMERRAARERKDEKAATKALVAAENKAAREQREYVRSEFDRLFKRLKTLVTGSWDRYGWGWKFQYKGEDYWLSYDSWESKKTPGDADGYDMSGHEWVLKNNFNAMQTSDCCGKAISLGEGADKAQLTTAVLDGLRDMNAKD